MATTEKKQFRGFHVRMPFALRSAWALLAKAYEWNLKHNYNFPPYNDWPPVFIPTEITECESTRDVYDGEGKCCFCIFIGHRFRIGVWVHSIRNTKTQYVEWVVDKILLDHDDLRLRVWDTPESLGTLV